LMLTGLVNAIFYYHSCSRLKWCNYFDMAGNRKVRKATF
jgi:hypothetical protein